MNVVKNSSVELWRYVLDQPVGGSGVGHVDVLIAELEDAHGRTGWGLSYVLAASGEDAVRAARRFLDELVVGSELSHPEVLNRRAVATMNRTGRGPLQVGLAAGNPSTFDSCGRLEPDVAPGHGSTLTDGAREAFKIRSI